MGGVGWLFANLYLYISRLFFKINANFSINLNEHEKTGFVNEGDEMCG